MKTITANVRLHVALRSGHRTWRSSRQDSFTYFIGALTGQRKCLADGRRRVDFLAEFVELETVGAWSSTMALPPDSFIRLIVFFAATLRSY